MHESSIPKKFKKRVSKKCNLFKGFEDSLPKLSHPLQGTDKFEKELDEVRRCVRNPSLSKKFLHQTNKKSEDIFKKYLKEETIDWGDLELALEEFDGVVTRLKFVYNRERPFTYFQERGEEIKTRNAGSPSFPSGHTAFAYFVCDYLSHRLPHRRGDLENLAGLIAQSRIENGVHFPSDITTGRFVGEQAAKFVLENKNITESLTAKETHKTFVRFLRRRAKEIRPNYTRGQFLESYTNDMSLFISETIGGDFYDCYEASKNYMSGYRLSDCTDNKDIRLFLEALCYSFFSKKIELDDMIKINKITEGESKIRSYEKATITGTMHESVSRIKSSVSKIDKIKNRPFFKLAVLSWISPFETGNQKISNIMFLKETGFNFDISSQIITDNLSEWLADFYLSADMKNILS